MDNDFAFLSFVALVIDGKLEEGEKCKHKCWVRPWIGRRDKCLSLTCNKRVQSIFACRGV